MDDMLLDPFVVVVAVGIIVGAIIVLFIIWLLVLGSRLKKLRKQYVAVMGNTGVTNVEEVIISLKQELAAHRQQTESLQHQMKDVQKHLPQLKGRVGVVRYNAFSDNGSDLSFSIAITNEEADGVVFSGLHSRENMYVYAKPVEKGQSPYPLTPEERKAIEQAK